MCHKNHMARGWEGHTPRECKEQRKEKAEGERERREKNYSRGLDRPQPRAFVQHVSFKERVQGFRGEMCLNVWGMQGFQNGCSLKDKWKSYLISSEEESLRIFRWSILMRFVFLKRKAVKRKFLSMSQIPGTTHQGIFQKWHRDVSLWSFCYILIYSNKYWQPEEH